MTGLLVAIALVIGVASSELLFRGVRADAWPARRLSRMRSELRLFHEASDDDARQRHLIQGGMATLTLSLAALAAIGLCAALFAAPIAFLAWNASQSTLYLAVSGAAAIAWWVWRRRASRA